MEKVVKSSTMKFLPCHGVLFQVIPSSRASNKKLLVWNENWEWKNDERALSEKVKHQRNDWDSIKGLKIDISYLKLYYAS